MVDESKIQALVRAASQGNSEAFGQLYDLLSARLFNFIFSRVGHRDTAEDLMHTVFLKAWTNLPKYKPSPVAKFSTWLFQIANYTIIDHWRTRKETVELDKLDNLHQFALDVKLYEKYDYLWDAMNELPDNYRTVLSLRFNQDLSIEEVAYVMNKSQVGIRVMQHRALKLLKKLLEDNGHGNI